MNATVDMAGNGGTGGAKAPWRALVLTLYPGMFPGPLGASIPGRAIEDGAWALETVDIRDFASDRHRTVDDLPFGGGPGMVMKPDVVDAALAVAIAKAPEGAVAICLSPRGKPFTQDRARELAAGPGVVLLCGRFEGIDARVGIEAEEIPRLAHVEGQWGADLQHAVARRVRQLDRARMQVQLGRQPVADEARLGRAVLAVADDRRVERVGAVDAKLVRASRARPHHEPCRPVAGDVDGRIEREGALAVLRDGEAGSVIGGHVGSS